MGKSEQRGPLDAGEGPWKESYNAAKRRRYQNLGMLRCRRKIADLLAAISPAELVSLPREDVAARLVFGLAELGALQLEAAGIDEENDNDVREIQKSRERARQPLVPGAREVYPELGHRPPWIRNGR